MSEDRHSRNVPRHALAYVGWAVVLNLPFLLCHPGWPLVDWPWVRSLAVGLVLIVVPGVPWVGWMVGRGWLLRFEWLWAVAASLLGMVAVVAGAHLAHWPFSGSLVWDVIWAVTNAAWLGGVVLGGPPGCGIRLTERSTWLGAALFLAAHLLFFYSATRVVPPMEDQDCDLLTCGYGLLMRFEPLQATDRALCHQFSHPPLAWWWTAGSFLYFDRLDYLEYYDAAAQRARAAQRGEEFRWFDGTVGGLTKGTVSNHRVVDRRGADYIVSPPLSDGTRRIPVWELENAVACQRYNRDPQKLVARTPHVLLAALTVALLGSWIARTTRAWSLAIGVAVAYATSPEVFVRSGYAGQFASDMALAWLALMTFQQRPAVRRRAWWVQSVLAGALLAMVDHKLVLLPAAVVLWRVLCTDKPTRLRRLSRPAQRTLRLRLAAGLADPAVVGFAAGTMLFWAWGLAIDPAGFWKDHIQYHFLDRLLHRNPLGYGGYPSRLGLWMEFWQHTSYILLPMGLATLVALVLERGRVGPATVPFLVEENPTTPSDVADEKGDGPPRPAHGVRCPADDELEEWRSSSSPVLWLAWALLTASVFTWVDWRQTKHLMPLMLPLHLAMARWAAPSGLRRVLLTAALVLLTAWNCCTLCRLATGFAGFPITPAW